MVVVVVVAVAVAVAAVTFCKRLLGADVARQAGEKDSE